MVPCAIGTDTGGSVRLPAAFCGIVGLKTTEGLIPTNGIVPLSHTLDTPGPMARSVSDAVTMFEAMVEHPSSIELPEDITGLKIGYLSDGEREGIEKDQLDAYDNALRILAKALVILMSPSRAGAFIAPKSGHSHESGRLLLRPVL